MKKKKGFTLVELLAVIVILAIILVIAIPQIMNVIKQTRLSSFKDSAILIATNAEKDYLSNKVLNPEYDKNSIKCSDVAKLNKDYSTCSIKYDEEGNTVIKLKGRINSKFEGLICEGSKDNMECIKKEPKRCKYEGTLRNGVKYVEGQYTYTYNIGNGGGWNIELTDKESTEPITSELCTLINEKPIVGGMAWLFYNNKAPSIDVSSFNTSNVTSMRDMFHNIKANEIIGLDSLDTSNVVDMTDMFYDCDATIIDLSSFNTSKVTNMVNMFYNNKASKIVGLNNFDTSNVINMSSMFAYSKAKSIDVSSFNTSKVTNMSGMFSSIEANKIIGLNNFDTSNVTNMSSMFAYSKAKSIDVSNFNTANVVNMNNLFYNSETTTIDVSNWNTSKVTDMSGMFYNNKYASLDLSSFDTLNVTNKGNMFWNSKATIVYARNTEEIERLSTGTSKPSTMNIVLKS